NVGNTTDIELFLKCIVEFFHFPGSGFFLHVWNSWHGSLLMRTKITPSLSSLPPIWQEKASLRAKFLGPRYGPHEQGKGSTHGFTSRIHRERWAASPSSD